MSSNNNPAPTFCPKAYMKDLVTTVSKEQMQAELAVLEQEQTEMPSLLANLRSSKLRLHVHTAQVLDEVSQANEKRLQELRELFNGNDAVTV